MTNGEMNQKLIEHFMGADYYIVDPISVEQANEVIYREIVEAYPHPEKQKPRKWGWRYRLYLKLKDHFDG